MIGNSAQETESNTLKRSIARRSIAIRFFRRLAAKPTPKKPKIIITQVDASGTAATVTFSKKAVWSVNSV